MTETAKTFFPIEDLVNWDKNPRTIDGDDMSRLKSQLLKLGQYKPLIIVMDGKKGTVIGGNMRLAAMRELIAEGHSEFAKCWVSIVIAKTEKERLEYALSDNDHAGHYEHKQLYELTSAIPDFNLSMYHIDSGYSMSLEDLADRYRETEEDDFDADKEARKITDPVSKRGDVYQLGNHRLMCGDATSLDDLRVLTGGAKCQMVFTDPPYNVDYSGRGKKTSNKILNDKMEDSAFLAFLTDVFASYRVAMDESAAMYVCYASRTHREFENAIEKNGLKVKNQIIWNKPVASMGWGDYRWKHEPILYCRVEGASVPFYGDRKQYTVWDHKPTDEEILIEAKRMMEEAEENDTTVWSLGRDSKYEHPTQKPIALIAIALRNSSKPGDRVIDLFGGSGSTLMACEQMERKCFTMELDPRYVDVIVKRWEQFTNQQAVKIA